MKRSVKFVNDTEEADLFDVEVGGVKVGKLRKAKHGPGFFLSLFDGKGGVKGWRNAAPGARIQQERDHVAKETYCKTRKIAEQRVLDNTPE